MAKKKPSKKRARQGEFKPEIPRFGTTETNAVDALTVAWMISVMATVMCGAIAGVLLFVARDRAIGEGARAFGVLLHLSAFLSAVLSLIMLALVMKLRRTPPPQTIVWFNLITAMAAIGTTFLY